MELLPTLTRYWTVGGDLKLAMPTATPGVLAIFPTTVAYSYCDPIATEGADQIGLLVYTTPSGGGTDGNVYVRVAWAGMVAESGQPSAFVEECVEVLGSTGVSYQRFSLTVKEFGPFVTNPIATNQSTRGTIWLPTAAHFFKIACYADVAVTNNAAVTVIIERARTGAPVGTARSF